MIPDNLSGLQTKELGEVCEVIAGQSPEGQFYNKIGKGLPFYQGKKEFSEKYIDPPTTWTTSTTKIAQKDDILMSVRAPVGPVNFSREKICIGRGLAAIRCSKEIDKQYLFCFFKFFEEKIIGNKGAVFNSINKKQIEDIEVPLPPLPEQKRIVAVLDEVFEGIAKAKQNVEKNLKNEREVFEASLHSIFFTNNDWDQVKLNDIVTFKGGGTPSKSVKKYWDGDIPWVSPKDMKMKNIIDSRDHISEEAVEKSSTSLIPKNSLLIVVRSGVLAHSIPIGITNRTVTINQDLKALIPSSKVKADFLYYLVRASKNRLLSHVNKGATVHRLQTDFIKDLKLTLPSITEQELLITKLDSLSEQTKKLEQIYKRKLELLEELKQSVLKKAFAGEL